jgi:hypothetical protein
MTGCELPARSLARGTRAHRSGRGAAGADGSRRQYQDVPARQPDPLILRLPKGGSGVSGLARGSGSGRRGPDDSEP